MKCRNAMQILLLKKGSSIIFFFIIFNPITLKMLSQMCLGPRILNLCLDFEQLDGKGVRQLIKHTNGHECQVGSTKKGSLKIKKIFISDPMTLKMLSYVRLGPRSPILCLDLKQLDGKRVKKMIKRTNGHEMLGRQYYLKKVIVDKKNLYFCSYHFRNAQLGAPWIKESKYVLRFVIA